MKYFVMLITLASLACTINIVPIDSSASTVNNTVAVSTSPEGYLIIEITTSAKNANLANKKAKKIAKREMQIALSEIIRKKMQNSLYDIQFPPDIDRDTVTDVIVEYVSTKLMSRLNVYRQRGELVENKYLLEISYCIRQKRMYDSLDAELEFGKKSIRKYLQNNKINKKTLNKLKKYFLK